MSPRSSAFLQGVVLAADTALPKTKRKVLLADANVLAERGLVLKIQKKVTPPSAIDTAHVFAPWLSYRRKNPSGKLASQVTARVDALAQSCAGALIDKSVGHETTLSDPDFRALLAGAQVVVKHLASGVPDATLMQDWAEFGTALPKLVRHYRQNGVPEEGIRELVTMEYTRNRLRSIGSVGGLLKGLVTGGAWYGWLEVRTTPLLASVRVDKEDWGESPKARGVVAGKHHISAQKDRLRGEQDAEVPVAGSKLIDLTLA